MNYELVNFCEFDPYASKAYCAIHGVDESLNLGDINEVDENKLPDFTMICGGSPCQDFSVAGKGKGAEWHCQDCDHKYNPITVHYSKRDKCPKCGSDNIEKSRSSLLVEWLRIIRAKRPSWGLYENVKNIVGKKFKPTFDLFIEELHEYGYNTYYKVLNAKDYGIPQNRERVFLFIVQQSLDNGMFQFPEPIELQLRLKDVLNEVVDEKFYLSEKAIQGLVNHKERNLEKGNGFGFSVKTGDDIANTIRARYYKDGSECLIEDGIIIDKSMIGLEGQPRLVNETVLDKVIRVGNCNPSGKGQNGTVIDSCGVARTVTVEKGEGQKILVRENKLSADIHVIGRINTSQDGVVVDPGGIAPTHTAGHGNTPKIVQVAQIYPNSGNPQAGRIFDPDGISPSIDTCTGGNRMPKIMEPVIAASRGRNPENPSDRTTGSPTVQRLEINTKGISNTITSVQKDNYVIEPNVLTPKRTEYGKAIRKKYESGEIKESRHNMTEMKPRTDGISNTLTTVLKDNYIIETTNIIRKLLPLECYRLMGFSEEDFFSAMCGSRHVAKEILQMHGHDCLEIMQVAETKQEISNTQLYKQAGNSIVVDVLYYIYLEIYRAMPYLFNNLKLGSFFSGIGAFETALDRFYKTINEENHQEVGGES